MSENRNEFNEAVKGIAKGCGFLFKSVGTVALGAIGLLGDIGDQISGIDMGISDITNEAINAIWADKSDEKGNALNMYNVAVKSAAVFIEQGNENGYDNSKRTAWKAYQIIHKDSTKGEDSLYRDFEWEFDSKVRQQR